MKNKQSATGSKFCVLAQVGNLIPGHLVSKLARKHGIETRARTFTASSHVVALLYAQLTHAIGLNDVCDGLRHHAGLLGSVRGGASSRSQHAFACQWNPRQFHDGGAFLGHSQTPPKPAT